MSSENPSGADDQQETTKSAIVLEPNWIVGFVDGEGCVCVSIHRSRLMERRGGWQLQPTFQVYQHRKNQGVLEALRDFFGIGCIRPKGPRSSVVTYSVDGLKALEGTVLPFFEKFPLLVKGEDFCLFATIVRSMLAKEHLKRDGFERIVELAYRMNANGKQRSRSIDSVLAGSSETGRGASVDYW
jgi:hypothetical protein